MVAQKRKKEKINKFLKKESFTAKGVSGPAESSVSVNHRMFDWTVCIWWLFDFDLSAIFLASLLFCPDSLWRSWVLVSDSGDVLRFLTW